MLICVQLKYVYIKIRVFKAHLFKIIQLNDSSQSAKINHDLKEKFEDEIYLFDRASSSLHVSWVHQSSG